MLDIRREPKTLGTSCRDLWSYSSAIRDAGILFARTELMQRCFSPIYTYVSWSFQQNVRRMWTITGGPWTPEMVVTCVAYESRLWGSDRTVPCKISLALRMSSLCSLGAFKRHASLNFNDFPWFSLDWEWAVSQFAFLRINYREVWFSKPPLKVKNLDGARWIIKPVEG